MVLAILRRTCGSGYGTAFAASADARVATRSFFSVGDIAQKKETCSGSDGFFCVRGCCDSSNDGCALTWVASSKKQATAVALMLLDRNSFAADC